MRIALAQLAPEIGDVAGNVRRHLEALDAVAAGGGADLVVTTELGVLGYPPRDLLVRDGVVEACLEGVRAIAEHAGRTQPGCTVLVGHPRPTGPDEPGLRGRRNAVSACRDGAVVATIDKRLLPGYDVFDEDRWFDPGLAAPPLLEVAGRRVGVAICEDLWQAGDARLDPRYPVDPIAELADAGAEVIAVLNASPFVRGKARRHLGLVQERARRHGVTLVAVNQVGGMDDLVFDGRSAVVAADGTVERLLPSFEAATVLHQTGDADPAAREPAARPVGLRGGGGDEADFERAGTDADPDLVDETIRAIARGLADYVRRTGHARVLVGLSGGIDSALVAALAAIALGPDAVHGLLMPSRFSSDHSLADAEALVAALGLGAAHTVPIEPAHAAYEAMLAPVVGEAYRGLPDENVQARIRGMLLMATSNATGALVLATSNKSELATGYSTLYGDMCGAFAPIGDLLKGEVWAMSRRLNEAWAEHGLDRAPIPVSSIEKPPSAELAPDQLDQDTLPPYDALDAIVRGVVDHDHSVAGIAAETGLDPALVERWARAIDRQEYKRFQSSIIPKVAPRTFGRGRPMPLVARPTAVASPAPTA